MAVTRNIKCPGVLAVLLFFACATMTSSWSRAKTAGTIEGYNAFIARCPNSALVDSAKLMIEDLSWQGACREHTNESYLAFQQQYPRGRHVTELRDSMEALAWDRATRRSAAGARAAFLRSFSDGKYATLDSDDARRAGAAGALDGYFQMQCSDASNQEASHLDAQYYPSSRDDADARRRADSLRVLWSRNMPGTWRCLSGKFHGGSVNFKVGVEGGDYTGAIVHVYYSSEYHQFGGYLVGVTDDMAANGWSEGDLFWAIDSAPTYSVTLQLGHSAPHCGKCVVRIGTRYSSDIPQYIPPQSFATFMNFTIETRKDSTLLELEPISDATVCNGPETWLKVSPR